MSAIERELIEKINQLSPEQQKEVLEFVERLETVKQYSARELMKLPVEERERLMSAAFTLAAEEDFEVFEAYREEGLDDPS
jgi:hypothetical protein